MSPCQLMPNGSMHLWIDTRQDLFHSNWLTTYQLPRQRSCHDYFTLVSTTSESPAFAATNKGDEKQCCCSYFSFIPPSASIPINGAACSSCVPTMVVFLPISLFQVFLVSLFVTYLLAPLLPGEPKKTLNV